MGVFVVWAFGRVAIAKRDVGDGKWSKLPKKVCSGFVEGDEGYQVRLLVDLPLEKSP